jgi:prepilin-type N-terminal cleavage/methylation domain-containing protein
MKSNKGFTLIELLVGILILGIIFGGVIYIFGGSSLAARTGMNQKQVYEDARVTMDYLKTTMRYADPTSFDPQTPDNTTTILKYTSTIKQHQRDANANDSSGNLDTKTWKITVALENGKNTDGSAWTDSKKKQLVIYRNDTSVKDDYPVSGTDTPYIRYPKYEANSGLVAAGTYTGLQNQYESGFPVIMEDKTYGGQSISVYKVLLPAVYKAGNENKTDTLVTRISPTILDYNKSTTGASASSAANGIIAAATALTKAGQFDSPTSNQFARRISSGALDEKILSGNSDFAKEVVAAKKIKAYMTAAGTYSSVTTSWLLIPVLSNNKKEVLGWTLYVAKNVVDDVKDADGKTANDKGELFMKNAAEQSGIYYMRRNYGMLTYLFTADADGNIDILDGTLGYATGVGDYETNNRILNSDTWTTNYLDLICSNKNNKYIEDQYDTTSGSKTATGRYFRIDYDESGREYTKATCATAGTTYSYPPNKPTSLL